MTDKSEDAERGKRIDALLKPSLDMALGPLKATAEVARLEALLKGRDDFIVSKGLWQEFCDQLPKQQ